MIIAEGDVKSEPRMAVEEVKGRRPYDIAAFSRPIANFDKVRYSR
jgi:hypothetical protein